MADVPVETAAAPVPAPRKRMSWGKLVGLGLLLVVVGLLLFEGSAVYFYQSSLSRLEGAISASRQPGKVVGVPLAEIGKHLSGFPIQDEVKDPANPGGKRIILGGPKRRKVSYHWPSLYSQFHLIATVDEKGNVIGVEGEYGGDQKKQATMPVFNPTPDVKVEKPVGLAVVPEGAVVLALDELKVMGALRKARCGSLAREIFRQAVLVAARDEIGADTLDAVLEEVIFATDNPKAFPLHVDVVAEPFPKLFAQARFVMKLTREEVGGGKFEWTSQPAPIPLQPTLEVLLERAEVMSRGELVKGLQAGGYVKSEAKGPAVSAPEGCEWRMDLVSQFARLRQLHSERRVKGETVENLGALIRAYANLGDLTEYHWGPMSKGLRARALVYANRMIAKYGKTAETLGHRAYAWALAGNHGLALADLKAIDEMGADVKGKPGWLKLITAYCKYEPKVFEGVEGELALYLRMRVLDASRDSGRTMDAVRGLLQLNPVCWRAVERMCETNKLMPQRQSTEWLADVTWLAAYGRIAAVSGLPEEAHKLAASRAVDKVDMKRAWDEGEERDRKERQTRVALMTSLAGEVKRSDVGAEPGWRMLGEMLNDTTFVQAWRALHVARYSLGVGQESMNHAVQSVMPLVQRHRFGKYLVSYCPVDTEAMKKDLLKIYREVPGTIYEMQCLWVANTAPQVDNSYYVPLCSHIDNHWDQVQGDLLRVQETQFEEWGQDARRILQTVTPYQPTVVADALDNEQVMDEKVAGEWEKRCAESPYLMTALGRKYRSLGRSRDAIRCFERSLELAPSHGAYEGLAGEYQKLDNLEAAEVVLEEAIKLPGQSLEQSYANIWLAQLMMRKGNWERAMEFAEEAAGSYSASGLLMASWAAEGLGDWKAAEEYAQRVSERYDEDGSLWYFWCVRTGRGNIEEAKKLAEKSWAHYANPPESWDQRWVKVSQTLLEGDLKESLKILTSPMAGKNSHQLLLGALIAERVGLPDFRDHLFLNVLENEKAYSHLSQLTNLFRKSLRDPKKFQWDEAAFLELVDNTLLSNVGMSYYFAGEFLETHGEHKLSEEYLRIAATNFNIRDGFCLFGTMALRKRGLPVGQTRSCVQPDDREEGIRLVTRATFKRLDKKFDETRKDLDVAMKKLPKNSVLGYLALGRLHQDEGKFSDAVADYREVLRLSPNSEEGRLYLATILAGCEKNELRNGKEAVKLVEEAIAIRGGTNPWMDSVLAMALAETGDFKKAAEVLEAATKTWRDQPELKVPLESYQEGKPYRYSEKNLPWTP